MAGYDRIGDRINDFLSFTGYDLSTPNGWGDYLGDRNDGVGPFADGVQMGDFTPPITDSEQYFATGQGVVTITVRPLPGAISAPPGVLHVYHPDSQWNRTVTTLPIGGQSAVTYNIRYGGPTDQEYWGNIHFTAETSGLAIPGLPKLGPLNRGEAVFGMGYTMDASVDGRCFAAGTEILTPDGVKPIQDLNVGDYVMAFPSSQGEIHLELRPQQITKIIRKSTDKWIELTLPDSSGKVYVTPGHLFLSNSGDFCKIEDLVADGVAELIDSQGNAIAVTARELCYADCPHLFENVHTVGVSGIEKFRSPQNKDKWQTYNLEVGVDNTYVAAGLRVHNTSFGDVEIEDFTPLTTNDLGGVSHYLNEQGDIVSTNPNSNYSAATLEHYGIETRHEDGSVTARTTLGGTLRAIADALGFDGEFGVQGTYARDNEGTEGNSPSDAAKPVIIDLDGDGVEINSDTQVSFDWDNDGFLEASNWAAADDGFLVIDLEADGSIGTNGGDGVIDQGREIAFAQWAPDQDMTDLQALAEARDADGNLIFDTNGDGVLDANDAVWGSMKIFQDLDQDGEVDEGELRTLEEWGISQINLSYDDGSSFSEYEDDVVALGNILHGLASYVMNGEVVEGGVGDVSLLYNTQGWRYVETDSGYQIEFESGDDAMVFWNVEGLASANVDLTALGLAGTYGDDRDNILDATGTEHQVVITGGAGSDQITGGEGDDMLAGGEGSDAIHAGGGHDVVLADSQDDISGGAITGGEGYDKLIVSEETTLNISDLSATGFEAVVAGHGNDSITALDDETSYNLDGNDGNDTLTTAGGQDVLSGGEGDDSLSAGAGSDRLFGGQGNDTLDGGDDADFLAGGAGNDTMLGGGGNDRYQFSRGHGHDLIHDYATGTIMERTEYYEEMAYARGGKSGGYNYVNELRTGFTESIGQIDGGIDTLEFGHGISVEDVLFSRVGDDALIEFRNLDDADTSADESDSVSTEESITIQDWSDQRSRIENFAFSSGVVLDMSQIMHGQTGHGEANNFAGTEEGDWLNSGGGNDTLAGNGGGDVLIAGAGNDSLDGGEGRDFLLAGDGDDVASGGDGDDYILGGDGNDTLNGNAGDDALSGDEGDDVLNGGAGNDMLIGGTGSDTLNGGAGDDTYIYFRGDGRDTIHDFAEEMQDVQEATGNMVYQRSGKSGSWVEEMRTVQRMQQIDGGWDTLQFGYSITIEDIFFDLQGDDLVMGVRQIDEDGNELTLDQMDDVVTVEDWSNEMSRVEELRFGDGLAIDISEFGIFESGYGADDAFTGAETSDLLSGGGGADTLSGEGGDDVLVGGDGDDDISGGDGDDDLFGGDGNDTLRGGAGDDYLFGGDGDDLIEGGAGDDVLTGGLGDDILRGGLGNDTYIFNRGDGHDTIDESAFSVTDGGTTTTEYGANDFDVETQTFSTGGKWPSSYEQNVWVSESRTGASVSALEGGDDIVQFGNYIDISDLIVVTNGTGETADLVVELAPVAEGEDITDSITITNWGTPEFRVETFRFANGFTLDVSSIGYAFTGDEGDNAINTNGVTFTNGDGAWLVGGEGEDTLTGSAQGDILVGGVGNDRMEGGQGDDIYVYSRGDGADTILDTGSNAIGTDPNNLGGDKLLFGVGITIEDLILHRDGNTMNIYVADQDDMSIPLTELTDVVSVENWNSAGNRIELLQFFNGLDFDVSEITNTYLGADLTGAGADTPVNDTLNGSNSADWMDGFAGDDILNALGGDDFIFGREGDDTLNGGNGDDILAGGDDNDVINGGNGSDVMTGGADDDVLNGDGGNDVIMGGTGNDTLNGGAGNDMLVGDLGDDVIIASAGQDQIRFGFGDGNDIYQGNTSFTNTDVFVFEDNIDADDVWFERIDNSLIVRLHGADDTFTFENWYYSDNPSAYVQGFAAGNEWLSYDQVNSLVTAMQPHIADLNDGTTAYGILVGETPDSVLTAIDDAWV